MAIPKRGFVLEGVLGDFKATLNFDAIVAEDWMKKGYNESICKLSRVNGSCAPKTEE